MKILLFGHHGQVGSALIKALPPIHQLEIMGINTSDDMRLRDIINSSEADFINAAPHTNADGAKIESDWVLRRKQTYPRFIK